MTLLKISEPGNGFYACILVLDVDVMLKGQILLLRPLGSGENRLQLYVAAPCLPLPLLFSLLLALLIAIEIVPESSLNFYFEASLLPF